jgi:hypothetical protein
MGYRIGSGYSHFVGGNTIPAHDMRNPDWYEDEVILALHLYFDPARGQIGAKNPRIIELSRVLRSLPHVRNRPDPDKFRNVNGVSRKLANFLAADPPMAEAEWIIIQNWIENCSIVTATIESPCQS